MAARLALELSTIACALDTAGQLVLDVVVVLDPVDPPKPGVLQLVTHRPWRLAMITPRVTAISS